MHHLSAPVPIEASPVPVIGTPSNDIFQLDDDGIAYAINGRKGTDLLSLNRASSPVPLVIDISDGGGGRDIGDGTTIANIERLFAVGASAGDDVITGGSLDDAFFAGAGHDTLNGGGGDDTLNSMGTEGPDALDGGDGSDLAAIGRGADSHMALPRSHRRSRHHSHRRPTTKIQPHRRFGNHPCR
jgi:Ca2+-binding RTX toxin-like protein